MLSCFLTLVDSCSGNYQCSPVCCAPMKIILPWKADNAWLISHVTNGFTSKNTLNQSGNWSSPCDLKGPWRNMQRLQQLPLQDAFARNPMTLREPCGNRAGKERWFTEFTACYWMFQFSLHRRQTLLPFYYSTVTINLLLGLRKFFV